MKLAIYVHDFRLEIGHSNALIELIRHLPESQIQKISEIEVVSQIATPLENLFSEFKGKLKLSWTKVPCGGSKPALLNSLFYHLWTFFYNNFFQKGDPYRIGVGACCFGVDASSVQFIQYQWTKEGLTLEKKSILKYFYKKLLFAYYEWCEDIIYQKRGVKIFTAAQFLTDYLTVKYRGIRADTFYSSVNLERFSIPELDRKEIKEGLLNIHPELRDLDLSLPVYIFVGAYERKGLQQAVDLLKKHENSQLIVVGSPSLGLSITWPDKVKVLKIKFSKNLKELYALSDIFIFPTIYEPFGLVLFEAMAMGLTIITNRKNVGASELLESLPEVYFCDDEHFLLPTIRIKTFEEKWQLRIERLKKLDTISWENSSNKLAQFLWNK